MMPGHPASHETRNVVCRLYVETHPSPEEAICDGPQQLFADDFARYAEKVEQAAAVAGKSISVAA